MIGIRVRWTAKSEMSIIQSYTYASLFIDVLSSSQIMVPKATMTDLCGIIAVVTNFNVFSCELRGVKGKVEVSPCVIKHHPMGRMGEWR
jgi:hypothetical protein